MASNVFLVARCGRFNLQLDLNSLILSQNFLTDIHCVRKFQLSMLEVLSFLDIVDKFNTEKFKVHQGNGDPYWCHRLLSYIEKSYLVKEIELPQ